MKSWFHKNRHFSLSVIGLTISSLYLLLGIHIEKHIRYTGIEDGLNYWLIFPFHILKFINYLAPFVFLVVLGKFIVGLFNQKEEAIQKSLGKTIILLFVINLAVLFTFVITAFADIDHRSSVKAGKYTYSLASRLENEYGAHYYIFRCHSWDMSFDLSCEKVVSFPVDPEIFSYDETATTELTYDYSQNTLYTIWNNRVIYSYQLNP